MGSEGIRDMGSFQRKWQQFRNRNDDERGASLVEYALLLALIAVVCITAITFLGESSSSKYNEFGECWSNAGSGQPAPAYC